MGRGSLRPSVLLACLGWLLVAGTHAQVCVLPPADIISWWPAEGDANDAISLNNGVLLGGVTFTNGEVGQAFNFNGIDGRVVVSNSPSLNFGSNQDFSIEAWISPLPSATDFGIMSVVDKRYAPTLTQCQGYEFNLANGQIHCRLSDDISGNGQEFGPAGPDLRDGNFHHVALSLARGASNGGNLYVDGQVVLNFDPTAIRGDLSNTEPFRIGNHASSFLNAFFKGRIDEVSLYGRALSAAEILAIYNAGSAGKCPPNNWTNQFSEKWESPSWSLGVLPASDQIVRIMNDGYKAVNIDSATVAEFPDSLTVGSLEVGAPTNALSTLLLNYFGLNTPLKVLNSCVIQPNGTLLNLYSSFEVDGTNGGALTIDGGTFTQEGGLTLVNAPVLVHSGSLNATNGDLNLGEVTVGTANSAGNFNQDGGSIAMQQLTVQGGRYTLVSGTLYALGGTEIDGIGDFEFLQWGGTNYGDITVNASNPGSYNIHGGLAQGNLLTIRGSFEQYGGLVDMQTVDWTGNNGNVLGLGTLRSLVINIHSNALVFMGQGNIVPGSVETESLTISNSARVSVTGYDLFVTNNLDLRGNSINSAVNLELGGGTVRVGTLTLYDYAELDQIAGTTELANGLSMNASQFLLGGGLLEGPHVDVGADATFSQSGGQNIVRGGLVIAGTYDISAGSLVADGIYLSGSLLLQLQHGSPAVLSVTNNGVINLGGQIGVGTTNAWLGQVLLSTNATINFVDTPAQLRFAAGSGVPWTTGALLVIANWTNSGATRVFFGNDASALTASQLAQIQFSNPGGFPAGHYPAQILSTGELVPAGRPTLQMTRTGSALVFTWSGNYQLLSATNVIGPYTPVPGASSPWTNYFTKPREFFRLQGL